MTSALSTPSSLRFWEAPPAARDSVFTELRARAPQWCPHPPNDPFLPDPGPDDGYWAIVRHADIREISHDPERFSSAQGVFQATPPDADARRARGHPIRAGEKVVMVHGSGNRDDRAFEHPERFDLGRDPNPHLGLGGGGPHYCMGAGLARTQLRALFTRLLRRYLVSNLINGIPHLPMHTGRERR